MNTSRILDKAHKGKGCVLAGAFFGKKVPVRPDSKPLKKGRDAGGETKQRVAPRRFFSEDKVPPPASAN